MATVILATMDTQVHDTLSPEIAGEGHTVVWARDGQEACDGTLSEEPALIFVERALPIFDGFEVAEILRADPDVPRELPIILLSDEPVDPHQFARSGFTEQFPKSHGYFEVRELLAAHIHADFPVW